MNAAERIYTVSTTEDASELRTAEEVARRIEDEIATRNLEPGEVLGSLQDLSERYGVGRSAMRQAIGLLERRGLGRLRPGPCGGFILAAPCADSVGEELANHFRLAGVSLTQLMDAREAIDLMAARLVAERHPEPGDLDAVGEALAIPDLTSQLAARRELARMSGAPALLPFTECLNSLTIDFSRGASSNVAGARDRERAQALLDALAQGQSARAADTMAALNRGLSSRLSDQQKPLVPESPTRARGADERTLAVVIARKLAAEILRGNCGTRLGSEPDLCERFSVSRLTLRQSIRLLQDSGLVECRRGRGNGLLVRDHRTRGSIRLVLAYLIGEKMDPMEAGTILFQMNSLMPALAVMRAEPEERAELETLLADVRRCDPVDRLDLLSLVHCVSRLADSPIIDLFSRCLAAYEARFHPAYTGWLPAELQQSYFALVGRLLATVPHGIGNDACWAKSESSRVMLAMSRDRPI